MRAGSSEDVEGLPQRRLCLFIPSYLTTHASGNFRVGVVSIVISCEAVIIRLNIPLVTSARAKSVQGYRDKVSDIPKPGAFETRR
jgi:hypothetical protein